MMAFITLCWRSARLDFAVLLACACLMSTWPGSVHAEGREVDVAAFRLERSADSILLSAVVKFDLPAVVEDALLKGVPVFFVADAAVLQERWYWLDKKVASVQRHMRLVYHPLTRRWRLGVAAGQILNNGLGVVLSQNFDSLADALAAVSRVSGWKIADVADIEAGARYRVDFNFRLDVSQLPRPLQIGVLGQSEWNISTAATQRLALESRK